MTIVAYNLFGQNRVEYLPKSGTEVNIVAFVKGDMAFAKAVTIAVCVIDNKTFKNIPIQYLEFNPIQE